MDGLSVIMIIMIINLIDAKFSMHWYLAFCTYNASANVSNSLVTGYIVNMLN